MFLQRLLAFWPVAFALTLVIEVPIFTMLGPAATSRKRAALAGAAGTCLTHPLLWFVWFPLIHHHTLATISGEILVVGAECVIFHLLTGRCSWTRAAAASALANAASFGLGLILRML